MLPSASRSLAMTSVTLVARAEDQPLVDRQPEQLDVAPGDGAAGLPGKIDAERLLGGGHELAVGGEAAQVDHAAVGNLAQA